MKFEDALPLLRSGRAMALNCWQDGAWVEVLRGQWPKIVKCTPVKSSRSEALEIVVWKNGGRDLLRDDWKTVDNTCQPIKFYLSQKVYNR